MFVAHHSPYSGATPRPLAEGRHPSSAMARRTITNNRRIYLCTYDVADDKRRTKLFELLKDHGEHVQFSVFLCSLTRSEIKRLSAVADEIIHRDQDQLLLVDIGADDIDWATQLSCLGKVWTPQVRSRII